MAGNTITNGLGGGDPRLSYALWGVPSAQEEQLTSNGANQDTPVNTSSTSPTTEISFIMKPNPISASPCNTVAQFQGACFVNPNTPNPNETGGGVIADFTNDMDSPFPKNAQTRDDLEWR